MTRAVAEAAGYGGYMPTLAVFIPRNPLAPDSSYTLSANTDRGATTLSFRTAAAGPSDEPAARRPQRIRGMPARLRARRSFQLPRVRAVTAVPDSGNIVIRQADAPPQQPQSRAQANPLRRAHRRCSAWVDPCPDVPTGGCTSRRAGRKANADGARDPASTRPEWSPLAIQRWRKRFACSCRSRSRVAVRPEAKLDVRMARTFIAV